MRPVHRILLGTACAAAIVGAVAATDAASAATHMQDARAQLLAGERSFRDEDPAAARTAFESAASSSQAAQQRLDGPVWGVARAIPRLGTSVDVVVSAADLAAGMSEAGLATVDIGHDVLAGEGLGELLQGASVDLDQLRSIRSQIEDVPLAPVTAALEALEASAPNAVLPALRDPRDEAIAGGRRFVGTVEAVTAGLGAAEEFLGGHGPRRYVVAAQNPAELRGTGGLIGFMAELTTNDGRIAIQEGLDFDAEDPLVQRTSVEQPRQLPDAVTRSPEFADRYDQFAGGQFIGSVNIDPDLPTVAPVLLGLYEQATGRALDGVILVDPIALRSIVAATKQPVVLPEALDTAGLPGRLAAADIPSAVMIDGYDAFGGGGPGKKAFDQAIILASLDLLFTAEWDAGAMVAALRDAAATRHVQLFSQDPATQATLQRLDVAGQLPDVADRDLLALTAVNGAPNKADVHVAHRVAAEIRLERETGDAPWTLRRAERVTVSVENPLAPDDHVEYITGSRPLTPFGSPTQGYVRNALVRTRLSIWTPPDTRLETLPDSFTSTSTIHGHRGFDTFLETPSRSTTSWELDLAGPVPMRRDGDEWVYTLELWRQAKAIPDTWDVAISPPTGWTVTAVDVVGGGSPTGMGVAGDGGQPISAKVEDGRAAVRGTVSRDAVVTVRMREG